MSHTTTDANSRKSIGAAFSCTTVLFALVPFTSNAIDSARHGTAEIILLASMFRGMAMRRWDEEIRFALYERPAITSLLTLALFIAVIASTVAAYEGSLQNLDVLAVIVLPVAAVWYSYARPWNYTGEKPRARIVVALVSIVTIGLLAANRVQRDRDASEAYRVEHETACQAQIGTSRADTVPQKYTFDTCASLLTHEEAIAICRSRVFKRGPLPDGWHGCSEYEAEILALPR
ncbi:hypothetical protein MKK69_16025 [Methylobacterium sp. J-026]|uniref:hypothetical protein n=1 Tax=Methylobacterium sp. J-026 TaxID=2836624 RepID=UPI001FBBA98C|nr:hypothetical protein [Methylobacterium sp. J-026]MCJ2135542.1 hypothetical protein [Methylobacterium sp. J-026]